MQKVRAEPCWRREKSCSPQHPKYPDALLAYEEKSYPNTFYVLEKDDDFAVLFLLGKQDSCMPLECLVYSVWYFVTGNNKQYAECLKFCFCFYEANFQRKRWILYSTNTVLAQS